MGHWISCCYRYVTKEAYRFSKRKHRPRKASLLESLSKDVFERRTSTGSEVFSLTICLDAKKFVLISFFSLIKTIYPRFSTKPPPNDAKRPLPVDVRRLKTLLLKLPILFSPETLVQLFLLKEVKPSPDRKMIIFLLL